MKKHQYCRNKEDWYEEIKQKRGENKSNKKEGDRCEREKTGN